MQNKQKNWKARLLLGLIKLIAVFVVAWYAMPAFIAGSDYFRDKGKRELATVGSVSFQQLQSIMHDPKIYNYGELSDMMDDQAPQHINWTFMTRNKVKELIAQIDKVELEGEYDPYMESDYYISQDARRWKDLLSTKLAEYEVRAEQKFGKEQLAAAQTKYENERYHPRFDWSAVYHILYLSLNAIFALLLCRFVFYMTKARLEGYKLRFEWIPHRAPLTALLIGVDYFVDFYPSGSPSGQVKAMLGWTFSTLFSALVLVGSAGSAGAQAPSASKKAKDKDPYTLQIDARYGENFEGDPNIQEQVRFTVLGRNSRPWLIESITVNSPTAITETLTPGFALKRRPYTFNVIGGFRATIAKRAPVKNAYSVLGGVQYYYRRPGKFAVYVPSLSLEFQIRPIKRTIFNFNTALLKEVKKFDFGTDITIRKPFDQSAQWTIGGVVGYKRNRKWPRFELGVFRDWLHETRLRLRMTQQFNL